MVRLPDSSRRRTAATIRPCASSTMRRRCGGWNEISSRNSSDRTTERNVLDKLAEEHAELAEEIRMLLFTFEDVAQLDDRSIQMVLKEVDQKDLAIALRGVSDEVGERMFSNMSERGAELLRDEISLQPPQRRRVVEEAQGRIVAAVRRLEESGNLTISRGAGGDDELM